MGVVCTKPGGSQLEKPTRKMIHRDAMNAAAMGDTDELERLFALDETSVNACDYDLRSALHLACAEGHLDAVKYLIGKGATATAQDRWGSEPLQEAMLHGHDTVVDYLLSVGVQLSNDGRSSLEIRMCTLAASGDLPRIKNLVKTGVSINCSDYDKRTVLHLAASGGHVHIVEYLIANGADLNCRDRWGGTPMGDAMIGGHVEAQEALRKAGADGMGCARVSDISVASQGITTSSCRPGRPNSIGGRAAITKGRAKSLVDAAACGDVQRIAQLLAGGASVDMLDYDSRSSLHLACSEGHSEAVKLLIRAQAAVDVQVLQRRGSRLSMARVQSPRLPAQHGTRAVT